MKTVELFRPLFISNHMLFSICNADDPSMNLNFFEHFTQLPYKICKRVRLTVMFKNIIYTDHCNSFVTLSYAVKYTLKVVKNAENLVSEEENLHLCKVIFLLQAQLLMYICSYIHSRSMLQFLMF